MCDKISLGFWYRDLKLKNVEEIWLELVNSKKISSIIEGETESIEDIIITSAELKSEDFFLGISKRIKNYIAVDFYSTSKLMLEFESILKKIYNFEEYPLPVESFLVRGEEESSGPLFSLLDKHRKVFKGIVGNLHETDEVMFTPQVRVINSSISDLELLYKMSKKYNFNPKIRNNNLWIDFRWSKFSNTWNMNFQK